MPCGKGRNSSYLLHIALFLSPGGCGECKGFIEPSCMVLNLSSSVFSCFLARLRHASLLGDFSATQSSEASNILGLVLATYSLGLSYCCLILCLTLRTKTIDLSQSKL